MLERIIASYLAIAVVTIVYCVIELVRYLPDPDVQKEIEKKIDEIKKNRPETSYILENKAVVDILIAASCVWYVLENGCIWPKFVYSTTINRVIERTKKD